MTQDTMCGSADSPDFDEGYADKLTQEAVERATRELRERLAIVERERNDAEFEANRAREEARLAERALEDYKAMLREVL